MGVGEWVALIGLVIGTISALAGILRWVGAWMMERFNERMAATTTTLGNKIDNLAEKHEASLRVIERHEARIDGLHDRVTKLEYSRELGANG